MKDNLTNIVFILDRSGSMSNLTKETIGGYNSFIEKQKEENGEATLTTVLFDTDYQVLHDNVDIKKVKQITGKEYWARGCTALNDAIGKTINTVGDRLRSTNEEDRPSKVIFVITTDGEENASKEFSYEKIKEMIQHQENKYNWQFLFLASNLSNDKKATHRMGVRYGTREITTCNIAPTTDGYNSMYCSISKAVTDYRNNGTIDENWKDDIIGE